MIRLRNDQKEDREVCNSRYVYEGVSREDGGRMARSECEWFHLTGKQPEEGEDAENK